MIPMGYCFLCTDPSKSSCLVENPAYGMKLQYEADFWCQNKNSELCTKACQHYAFNTIEPLDGCWNLWGEYQNHGVFFFENVKIIPNAMFGINGNWTLPVLTMAAQTKTFLSKIWLMRIDPHFAAK